MYSDRKLGINFLGLSPLYSYHGEGSIPIKNTHMKFRITMVSDVLLQNERC